MRADWSDDDVALLRKLWAGGETAAAIALKLGGLSRSAVLGKIFRLRLPPAEAKAPRPAKPRVARRRPPRSARLPLPSATPDNRPKSLFELTNCCCRWPYRRPGTQKYFFCGVQEADLEAGIPYCARHMKRAYLVPPPRDKSVRKTPWRGFGGGA